MGSNDVVKRAQIFPTPPELDAKNMTYSDTINKSMSSDVSSTTTVQQSSEGTMLSIQRPFAEGEDFKTDLE
jgi:hypothetical protein